MFADKTLLLKGLAGVAAVGAAGGGTFIFRKELGLVDSSNNANDAEKDTPEEDETTIPSGTGTESQTQNLQNDDQQAQKQAEETERKNKEAKKSKVNEQLTKLGLESGCHLDITNFSSPTEFSKECELDQVKLQKIHFSNKGENEVTVSGLTGNIKLKITNKQGSEDAISYTFKEIKTKLTISGDPTKPDIVLKENVEREFEENSDGKLSKVSRNTNDEETKITALNQKLSTLKIPDKCRFDEKENDDNSIECNLNKTELQRIPFSNKGNSEVTVTGLNSGSIKLKIEKKAGNNQLSYKFSGAPSKLTISGDSTKPNITLKANEEREFEEKENGSKLGKVSASSSSDASTLNQKLKTLKIPNRCWFEEGENEESIECDLSKLEDLKKIEFLNKESGKDSRIEGSINGLKLTINRLSSEEGSKKYKSGIDLEFIFSGYSGEIKIKDNRTDVSSATPDIILVPNTNTPFTITDSSATYPNRLSKHFVSNTIDGKLGLSCTGSAQSFNCTPWPDNTTIKVLNSADGEKEEINVGSGDTDKQILTTTENTANYELGIKFTVKTPYPSSSPKLTSGSSYEAKYIKDKGGWLLVKKG